LRRMESRLAESEKLIARQYSSSGQRLSQLSGTSNGLGGSGSQFRGGVATGQGSAGPNSESGNYSTIDPESGLRWQSRSAPR
jgi:hypothetical protein